MPPHRALLCGAMLLIGFEAQGAKAQAPPVGSDVPTIQVTSRLVFLDVTVLDRKGDPVVNGLTEDDFKITEDKKPQRIFSFEAPETHVADAGEADDNPAGKAPITIFVLDLLNSDFQDFAYIRYSMRKYLKARPPRLSSPAELMVLGNKSLEMVQGYTRSTADMLYALDHVPAALPYKEMNGSFFEERFGQSIDALQQIALQNKGISGRKNIVWVGHGGPSVYTEGLPNSLVDQLNRYVDTTTNMLVDARMSLFVIYPGLPVAQLGFGMSELAANADIGDDDPFAGDINFGVFVNETGGNLFYNRNDVDAEIKRSQQLGSEYYTLTYQPKEGDANGKFRRIRVTMRDPGLHVVTKAGYFAPDQRAPIDPRQQAMYNIAEAAQSTVPFQALRVTIQKVVRYPDSGAARLTLLMQPANLNWQTGDDGDSTTDLTMAAVSLSGSRDILASKLERLRVRMPTQDAAVLAKEQTQLHVTIRVPRKTKAVRVVIETEDSGRMGAAELDRKTLDAAPAAPTPPQKLAKRALLPSPPTTTPPQ